MRAAAVDALVAIAGDVKGPARDKVTGAVRSLLTDSAAEVCNRAIAASGSLGDRSAIPALIELAGQPATRFEAGLALAELPDMRALQVYCAALTTRTASSQGLGRGGRQACATGGRACSSS